MVPCLRRIIEQRAIGSLDNLFKRCVLPFCITNQSIKIVDISLFMLSPVVADSFSADGRLKSIGRIGEFWLAIYVCFHKKALFG